MEFHFQIKPTSNPALYYNGRWSNGNIHWVKDPDKKVYHNIPVCVNDAQSLANTSGMGMIIVKRCQRPDGKWNEYVLKTVPPRKKNNTFKSLINPTF